MPFLASCLFVEMPARALPRLMASCCSIHAVFAHLVLTSCSLLADIGRAPISSPRSNSGGTCSTFACVLDPRAMCLLRLLLTRPFRRWFWPFIPRAVRDLFVLDRVLFRLHRSKVCHCHLGGIMWGIIIFMLIFASLLQYVVMFCPGHLV